MRSNAMGGRARRSERSSRPIEYKALIKSCNRYEVCRKEGLDFVRLRVRQPTAPESSVPIHYDHDDTTYFLRPELSTRIERAPRLAVRAAPILVLAMGSSTHQSHHLPTHASYFRATGGEGCRPCRSIESGAPLGRRLTGTEALLPLFTRARRGRVLGAYVGCPDGRRAQARDENWSVTLPST